MSKVNAGTLWCVSLMKIVGSHPASSTAHSCQLTSCLIIRTQLSFLHISPGDEPWCNQGQFNAAKIWKLYRADAEETAE